MDSRCGGNFVDPHEAQQDVCNRQMEELEQQAEAAATSYERLKIRCKILFLKRSHRIGWRVAQW